MIRIDGQETSSVSVFDRGLNYGDGLFETIALIRGKPELWRYHWARFSSSAEALGFSLPDESFWLSEIKALAAQADAKAVVKLILTRGDGERGYAFSADQKSRAIVRLSPWPNINEAQYREGIRLGWCATAVAQQPALAGMKHLNRMEQVLARREWTDEFDEGVMLDLHGHVIEGTMSNLFMKIQGQWFTPMLDSCGVAGVVRRWVLDYWSGTQNEIVVTDLNRDHLLYGAKAAFITNSVIGVIPVNRVSERALNIPDEVADLVNIIQQQRN